MLGAGIRIDVSIDDGIVVDDVSIDDGIVVDDDDGVIVVNHSRHSSIFAEDKSNVAGFLSIYISELMIVSD
jgi:hypothetical protein